MPNAWPGVSRRVVEILLEDQPDLIEICDKYSLHYLAGLIRKEYLKGFAKRPVLIGLSCERMDDNLGVYLTRSPVGKAFARWYMKWVYFGFFDHHIVNSEHVAMELREASRGHVRERGIYVRPPGSRSLDVRRLNPTSDWAARWPPRSFVRRPGWHGRRTSRC